MAYFKLAFYVEAKDLEAAHEYLAELLNSGANADTEQEITQQQYKDQNV